MLEYRRLHDSHQEIFMTKRTLVLFALIFSVFFISASIAANTNLAAASSENLDRVVAVVNSSVITRNELDAAMTQASKQLAASANPNAVSDTKLKQLVLQQLIDEKLQLELAERAKITISDKQVTQAIQRIAQGYQLTLPQLKEKLQQEGMSYTAYRKMIHKQLLVHQVQQSAIGNKVTVTPADVDAVLAQYQAQSKNQQAFNVIDIVVDTKQHAEQIIGQLKNGADINTVAPNNTKDLGWKTAETLPSLFLQQLESMQTGDVAGPIQAPNGFHVIKLMGMHGNGTTPTQAQLKNMAYQMQFQKAVEEWMKTIRKTAYVKIT